MKRQEYRVTIANRDDEREIFGTATTYAMNSGIAKSLQLLRLYAKSYGITLDGAGPVRTSDTYRRVWQSADHDTVIEAVVTRITP